MDHLISSDGDLEELLEIKLFNDMANISTDQYINKTHLETDPFESISEDDVYSFTNTTAFHKFLDIHEGVTRFFAILSGLIALAASIFLIVSILRFKKLRSSRINIQILNISLLYLIQTPMALLTFYADLGTMALAQIYVTVLILYMLFAFFLGLDWYIVQKHPRWKEIICKYQNLFTAIIYVAAFLEWIVTFWYAKTRHMIRLHLLFSSYIFILIGAIVLNIVKKCSKIDCRSSKTSYAFVCSNLIVFSLTPILLHHFFFNAVETTYFIVLTSFIPEIFFILHPVIVVCYLVKKNKHFRMAYYQSLQILKQEYQAEELEESDSEEVKANGSRANFSATDEQLDPREITHEVNLS